MVHLPYRPGRIARLNASVFYAAEVERGLFSASNEPPSIVHKCAFDVDKSTVAGAYAVAELTGGQRVQIILTHDDLQARRLKAQGGGKSGPWRDEFAAMARKSALRALFSSGLVPMSDELADSFGVQHAEPAQPAQEVTEAPLVLDVNERTMMAIGMDAPE